jgi:hypothetical protein
MSQKKCYPKVWNFVRRQSGRLRLQFLAAYAPETQLRRVSVVVLSVSPIFRRRDVNLQSGYVSCATHACVVRGNDLRHDSIVLACCSSACEGLARARAFAVADNNPVLVHYDGSHVFYNVAVA